MKEQVPLFFLLAVFNNWYLLYSGLVYKIKLYNSYLIPMLGLLLKIHLVCYTSRFAANQQSQDLAAQQPSQSDPATQPAAGSQLDNINLAGSMNSQYSAATDTTSGTEVDSQDGNRQDEVDYYGMATKGVSLELYLP